MLRCRLWIYGTSCWSCWFREVCPSTQCKGPRHSIYRVHREWRSRGTSATWLYGFWHWLRDSAEAARRFKPAATSNTTHHAIYLLPSMVALQKLNVMCVLWYVCTHTYECFVWDAHLMWPMPLPVVAVEIMVRGRSSTLSEFFCAGLNGLGVLVFQQHSKAARISGPTKWFREEICGKSQH